MRSIRFSHRECISNQSRDALDEALALAEDNLRSAAKAHHGTKLFLLKNYQTYRDVPKAMRAWSRIGAVDLRNRIEIVKIVTKFTPQPSVSGRQAIQTTVYFNKVEWLNLRSVLFWELLAPAYMAAESESANGYIAYRELALARCLRVLNALQRRGGESTETGNLGLPESATMDPFTDGPLRVVRTKTGWVVYSMGEDLRHPTRSRDERGIYVVGKVEELTK